MLSSYRPRAGLAAGLLAMLASLAVAPAPGGAQTPPPLKLGVITDLSSAYSDLTGKGSILGAEMAIEDFGSDTVLGRKIVLISADHQGKADIGSSLAGQWF